MSGTALALQRTVEPTESGHGGFAVFWTVAKFGGATPAARAVRGLIAPAGTSIAAVIRRAMLVDPLFPEDFFDSGSVTVNGRELPRAAWSMGLRPHKGVKLLVVLHPGMGRGGGNLLASLVQIAAIVASIALLQPEIYGALALTATTARFAALGVGVIASLGARALAALPTTPTPDLPLLPTASPANLGRAGASGNVLAPSAPLPRMTGERWYAPPFGCNPYVEIDGDDEIVEALWVFAEPTQIAEVRLGDVSLDAMDDAEVQISEGKPGDGPLTLIARQTATDDLNLTVSRHATDGDNPERLANQIDPEMSLPIWHPLTGRDGADEIVVTLSCPGGLVNLNSPTSALAVPMRIALRRRGDDEWTFGPEIHFHSKNGRPFHKFIRLLFQAPPLFVAQAPGADAPYLAFKAVPAQTVEPPRPGWQASDYFSAGSGGDVMSASTFGAHNVRNVSLEAAGATLHLDPATFAAGVYEIKVIFGATYTPSQFNPTNYFYNGIDYNAVHDLFGFYSKAGIYKLAASRANLRDDLTVTRAAAIWHETPLPQPEGIAFIAIRCRNRQLGELTARAAGLVPQWDGTEWSGLDVTRNPAPHFRDRLAKLFPAALIGDAAIVDWQTFCTDNGYETCAVLREQSFIDGLNLVASAGRARPRQSEIWDVLVDRDTSGENTGGAMLSPRNTRSFSFNVGLLDQVGGLRVRFADRALDHKENFIIVRNPNASDPSLPLEEMSNEAQDDADQVRKRALFDLAQAEARPAKYQFDVPAIGLGMRRGDLYALAHDLLAPFAMGARIRTIVTDGGGNVTGLTLDGTLPTPADQAWSNIAAAWSNYSAAFAAARFGVAIRLADRSELKAEIVAAGGESDTITFVTPFAAPAGLAVGCHVVGGPLNEEYKRVKIDSAIYKGNMEWSVTCVDEANEIHAAG